jgi:hypothetical protein
MGWPWDKKRQLREAPIHTTNVLSLSSVVSAELWDVAIFLSTADAATGVACAPIGCCRRQPRGRFRTQLAEGGPPVQEPERDRNRLYSPRSWSGR